MDKQFKINVNCKSCNKMKDVTEFPIKRRNSEEPIKKYFDIKEICKVCYEIKTKKKVEDSKNKLQFYLDH